MKKTKDEITQIQEDWCRQLGVIGWALEAQTALLCALVSGGNLIFCSKHGRAKTMLCRRLSAQMQLNFRAVDCSKADESALMGYINPQGLASGRVEYIATPTSLLGGGVGWILLDELNRSRMSTLNTYAEILYGRSIQGVPLQSLHYVWAAINPGGEGVYTGADANIDQALLSRFSFLIEPPGLIDMSTEEFHSSIGVWEESDAPLIDNRCCSDKDNAGSIMQAVAQAQNRYPSIMKNEGERWSSYCRHLVDAIYAYYSEAKELLEMRCIKSLHRAIIARRSLDPRCLEEDFKPETCCDEVGEILPYCLPILRLRNGRLEDFPFEPCHMLAVDAAFGHFSHKKTKGDRLRIESCSLNSIPDHIRESPRILLDIDLALTIGRRLSCAIYHPNTPEQAGEALATLIRLLVMLPEKPDLPGDLRRTLLSIEDDCLRINPVSFSDIMEALSMPPDAADADIAMQTCIAYIACREGAGRQSAGNYYSLWGWCRNARDHTEKILAEIRQIRLSLINHLRRASQSGENGLDKIKIPIGENQEDDSMDYLPF